MSSHTYQEAVEKLNSLQSNAATLEAVRASGGRLSQFAIPEMLEYLGRIGYSPDQLNALNVIHITGTKGKGSTSAFVDSILRHAKPDWKIGLYTSPHLVAVRERIRINGQPISEELFTKYFFEVWDRLQSNTARALESTSLMPGYFRFITLLAFHAFLECKVDATILEVGVGGTYDSTNVVPKPVVTGVTALGIDHVGVLGKTLEEIAWQKGGIFKEGVPAHTVSQPESPLKVLRNRAQELKASSFNVVEPNPRLASTKLDGAHTIESLQCCFKWFTSPGVGLPEKQDQTRPLRVLIFNCTSGRSGDTFIGTALETIRSQLSGLSSQETAEGFFDRVLFCTNITYADGHFKGDLTTLAIPEEDLAVLKTQQQLATAWSTHLPQYPTSNIFVLPSVEHAIRNLETLNTTERPLQVLVSGSLHLVGGVIEVAGLSEVAL
ncbi:hypothetical protein EST38_g1235 [Candolleomyces aberdarensis]|uniref:tetrahydrofolate synthase n=1 Tax=Candolleomyces aberdarensis TaxID=2316362 RepID=A0A4Q2DZ57_9AGAR|nr:hypothetical protein EST38_g1235 [Candolleomyces aberdarensis]